MKRRWVALLAGLCVCSAADAALDNAAAEALMKKNGCAGCHEVGRKVIGPAFQDVAARYRGDNEARRRLTDKVKRGGTHVWGEAAMPPNVLASDADIAALVDWILRLEK